MKDYFILIFISWEIFVLLNNKTYYKMYNKEFNNKFYNNILTVINIIYLIFCLVNIFVFNQILYIIILLFMLFFDKKDKYQLMFDSFWSIIILTIIFLNS